ncbi:electron transfer flavoprotein subunit alpha/FixB family protein [Acidocella sp.]|uniref:electron transfer flavoprotein subunit alpha/FixB family protein n=1 Tax=Acidocella sp. TaxID=50710 RepID=UPI00263024FB|nr:FAD-binding protein [Acidocella sp.]
MTALVVLDSDVNGVKQAARSAVAAAAKLGVELHGLVVGHGENVAADAAAKIPGLSKILVADHPGYDHELAEPTAALLVELAPGYTHIFQAATTMGKNVMPRLAALLDVQVVSDISGIIDADTFVRPIYAGNALATVKSADTKKVISVRATAFDAVPAEGGSAAIETLAIPPHPVGAKYVGSELSKSERPELTSARVIISGGRGMQSAENFAKVLEPVADKLGAAVGASRAAVDSGFAPNDFQVGQTGKIVAPELYVAVGISGAIQHLAGMKDSKVIVAINKDEEAPIFQVADYGLVGDLFTILPELEKAL